ncbi:hypothetical protein NUW54_g11814 [Trametes sanguinea]|uniref:Uncharacterized protein n=1 Tax=Trametes sanguinea TaxID=158606 RepID=A0ACC1N901_9APHY|nr:hypothetical protein NUW54_g11814 [Trametes sanguinea]
MHYEHLESPREKRVRDRIGDNYLGLIDYKHKYYSITFQPRGIRHTQDRVVTDNWNVWGKTWLFFAVFDGHLGPATADYASKALPAAIYRRFCTFVRSIGGRLDRSNLHANQQHVTDILKDEVNEFDKGIGDALQSICPCPWELDEQAARQLISQHPEIVKRAFGGTTVAMTLINLEERFMWTVGVGDSSVGLSFVDNSGNTCVRRLFKLHTCKNPQEYYRITMAHPYPEYPVIENARILDWLERACGMYGYEDLTCALTSNFRSLAIDDFSLKLHAWYLASLLQYAAGETNIPFSKRVPRIRTPPYVVSEPSVEFTDLQPFWNKGGYLFLFTDGVDDLVDDYWTFNIPEHGKADHDEVVGGLLADQIDPQIESVLGHKVIPKGSGREGNRATDVLGNLLGGTNVDRLEMAIDMGRLQRYGSKYNVNDVTIVVWSLTE